MGTESWVAGLPPVALGHPAEGFAGLDGYRLHAGREASPYAVGMAFSDLDVDTERLRAVCERFGVARLEVFGSVGRGESTPDSDIDLLYELAPGRRLGWEIESLAEELGAVLGRRIDLVSRSALNRRLRDRVLAEARLLYAA